MFHQAMCGKQWTDGHSRHPNEGHILGPEVHQAQLFKEQEYQWCTGTWGQMLTSTVIYYQMGQPNFTYLCAKFWDILNEMWITRLLLSDLIFNMTNFEAYQVEGRLYPRRSARNLLITLKTATWDVTQITPAMTELVSRLVSAGLIHIGKPHCRHW